MESREVGWCLLVGAVVVPLLLLPLLGPTALLLGWLASPLGLLVLGRVRPRPRGLRGALAAWGLALASALAGLSLTIGTPSARLASFDGGEASDGLGWAFPLVSLLPLTVMLAWNTTGPARRAAQGALACMALAMLLALLMAYAPPSRATGAYARAGSLAVLLIALAYLAGAAALGLGRSVVRARA